MRLSTIHMHGRTSWLLAVPVAIVIGTTSVRASSYEGYYDCALGVGFEMAMSTIEYYDVTIGPTPGVNGVSAWCGIDNRNPEDTRWLQAGWRKPAGVAGSHMYYEYTDKDEYSLIMLSAPPASATYGVEQEAIFRDYMFIVDGQVAGYLFETQIDQALTQAYFGAEIHDSPTDYTPGSVSNPCSFTSCRVRVAGGTEATAPLSGSVDTADHGELGFSFDGSFEVWDSRVP